MFTKTEAVRVICWVGTKYKCSVDYTGQKTHLRTRQCHADSVLDLQESDVAIVVAPNKGEKNDVVFLPLEVVYYSQTNTIELLLGHQFLELVQLT